MRLRRVVLLLATAAAGAVFALPAAAAPPLAAVHTWAFGIGDGTLTGDVRARFAGYDLVVLDGEIATAAQVAALHRDGTVVLAYLDAGTIEPYRSWYPAAKRYRLGYWPEWKEWYANVRAPVYRALLTRVARTLLAKGFDGLFLDNVDMVETHPRQAAGMKALVAALSRLAHAGHGYLFAQNGENAIGPLVRYLDGWNREDVSRTYAGGRYVPVSRTGRTQAVAALRRLHAAGLLVVATDYTAARDAAGARAAFRTACNAGALPFVSDLELTRIPQPPPRC